MTLVIADREFDDDVMCDRIIDILLRLGFVSSKSEARRLIRQGAVKFNDKKIASEHAFLLQDVNGNWGVLEVFKEQR